MGPWPGRAASHNCRWDLASSLVVPSTQPPLWCVCALFLCVASSCFLSIVLAPSCTCSTVHWMTRTPLSPPPCPGVMAWHRSIRGAVGLHTTSSPLLPDTRQGPAQAPAGGPPKVGHYQMTDSFISGVESGRMLEGPSGWWSGGSRGVRRYSQVGGDGWCCRECGCQSQALESVLNKDFSLEYWKKLYHVFFFCLFNHFSVYKEKIHRLALGRIIKLLWHLWSLSMY